MAWTVNSIDSNKKADVNFKIGISLVRNFRPPHHHQDISTLYQVLYRWNINWLTKWLFVMIYFLDIYFIMENYELFWTGVKSIKYKLKKDFSLSFETLRVAVVDK